MIRFRLLALLISAFTPIAPIGGGGGGIPIPQIDINLNTVNLFSLEYLSNNGDVSKGEIGFRLSQVGTGGNYYVYIVNEYYPNGYLITSGVSSSYVPTISFTYDNSHNGMNNKIRIEYYPKNKDPQILEQDIPFVRSANSVLSGTSYTYNTGNGRIQYALFWGDTKETYTFKNFESQYIPSFYHNFSLSDYEIQTSSTVFTLSAKNIDLYITNRNGVFGAMPNNGSYLKIPLEIVGTSSPYKLKLKNSYYVNPNTLLMSETYKDGYVETNHIYFPHNEMRYQGEYEGRIVFNSFNRTKSNLTFSFTLNAQLNLMGDCIDSEYCVVTKDAYENPYAYEIYD